MPLATPDILSTPLTLDERIECAQFRLEFAAARLSESRRRNERDESLVLAVCGRLDELEELRAVADHRQPKPARRTA